MKQFAILALNTGDIEHELLILKANGIPAIKVCKGVYKGVSEDSYMVSYSMPFIVHNLATLFGQESILLLNGDNAEVRTTKGFDLMIGGKWVNVGTIIPNNEAYTKIDENYYIIA